MKIKILFIPILVALSVGFTACKSDSDKKNGSSTSSKQDSGSASVSMNYIYGVNKDGSPAPTKDISCKAKFAAYFGKAVTTKYEIDPATKMMFATSKFEGKEFTLSAFGESDEYALGVFKPSNFPAAYSVVFSISLKFTDPASQIILLNGADNCLLSSQKNPLNAGVNKKFAMHQQDR